MALKTKQQQQSTATDTATATDGEPAKPGTITLDGEEFVLPRFSPTMITRVRDEVARRKRRDMLRQIAEMRDALPPAFWKREWDRALSEAMAIKTATPAEIGEWLDSREGVAFSLHLLIEKSNPGRFELDEMQLLVDERMDDAFDEMLAAREAAAPAEASDASSTPPVSIASAASADADTDAGAVAS